MTLNLPPMRRAYRLLLLTIVGSSLLYLTLGTEALSLPPGIDWIAHFTYRLMFFVSLPFQIFDRWFTGGDYSLGWVSWTIVCFGLPWLAWSRWNQWRAGLSGHSAVQVPIEVPEAEAMLRRKFLRTTMGVASAVGLGVGIDAVAFAPERLRIRRYEIPIADLPPTLDGLRIIHISDTHYGPFVSMSYLKEMTRLANRERGDLIVLTGDYVHKTPRAIDPGVGLLAELEARLGIVAVLGNHDHWEGAGECRDRFAKIGIPLLDNTRHFLNANGLSTSTRRGSLCLAGVGDLWEDEVDVTGALRQVPDAMPRLLLSHNPDVAEELPGNARIDLMLSGHTHGGQVWLPGLGTPKVPSAFGQKYAGGLCQGPRCRVLVSRGVGMAILPVRLGVWPEIGVVTLRR